jgi:NTE family protein
MQKDNRHKKVIPFTLVLGGGGARGLAHIGILRALEKNDLIPSLIVGTSMGALVGGMYAQLRSADAVEEKIRKYLQSDFFKQIGLEQFSDTDNENSHSLWDRFAAHLRQRYFLSKSVLGTGTFAQETLLQGMNMLLEEGDIHDLSLRFAAVTSDLVTGEEIVFTSGSIITAIAASCAVLGIVAPLKIDSRLLIDGTVTSTIPVPAAHSLSRDLIIAIDVRQSLDASDNYQHGYEIFIRASDITRSLLNDIHLKQATIILKPDVANVNWNEFSYISQCIHKGEQSVEENLSILTRTLVKRSFRLFHW